MGGGGGRWRGRGEGVGGVALRLAARQSDCMRALLVSCFCSINKFKLLYLKLSTK